LDKNQRFVQKARSGIDSDSVGQQDVEVVIWTSIRQECRDVRLDCALSLLVVLWTL
jgi:hypothetical protein